MRLAEKYIRPVSRGVTRPQLLVADDGLVYVVKLIDNRMGQDVLVNEYLAGEIGKSLSLCFPPSDLLYLSQNAKTFMERRLQRKVARGPHFASLFLAGSHYVTVRSIRQAINWPEMAGIVFFDHLFHNFDRTYNYRNLLIRKENEGARIYAIDHSHLFYRGRWTVESLHRQQEMIKINCFRLYGILLKHYLKPEHFSKYLAAFTALSDDAFMKLVESIPQEWEASGARRQALFTYLVRRRELADKIVASLCQLIPDQNRGTDKS